MLPPRPPVVLDNPDNRLPDNLTALREVQLANGNHGRVPARLKRPQPLTFPLLNLPGQVDTGNIDPAAGHLALPAMLPAHLGPLLNVEVTAAAMDGQEPVLGKKVGVVLPQALALGVDIGKVIGVVPGYLPPVVTEVALDTVPPLHLEVGLLYLLKQRAVIPGSAVVDGGNVSGSAHRPELLAILFLTDILGLVYLEQDMSGVAHHVSRFVGGEEYGPGAAQPDDIAPLGSPDAAETGVVQPVLKAHHRDNGLRLEGGRALDEIPGLRHIEG